MYQRLYEDEWYWIMIKFARQMGKSTYDANWLGLTGTTVPNSRATFVTHEDEALSTFSIEKFRDALWAESPLAGQFIKGSTYGSVGLVQTKINSSLRLVTDAHNYKHVEGKSTDILIFDEANHHDLDSWIKAKEAQSFTHGRFIITGIGGIKGTKYVTEFWDTTDQRKWHYDKEYWRSKLEYRKSGHNRLVFGDYMIDLLNGYWRAQISQNGSRHGYYLSQYDAPWVPLKKIDAVELYGLPEDESIQWKEENYSQAEFRQHVLAEDVEGELKPITKEMMYKLLDRNLSFTSSDKIEKHRGRIYGGADWGGGSKTIIWIWQCINKNGPVFQLLYAKRVQTSDVKEQYNITKEAFEAYEVDQAVVDAGGGSHQVQELMKYFGPRCLKNIYLTRPEKPLPDFEERKKYRIENKFQIDKTHSIGSVIDLIKRPYATDSGTTPRIILPAANMEEIDWIIEQFTNEEAEVVKLKSQGQPYVRYYTPDAKLQPDDALHACNYSWIAWLVDTMKPDPVHFTLSR